MARDADEGGDFTGPGTTYNVEDNGGGMFSDLFTGQGLTDLANSAGFAAPFFAPGVAMAAFGGGAFGGAAAGAAAGGADAAGGALGFAGEAAGAGGDLSSFLADPWAASGMSGGTADAASMGFGEVAGGLGEATLPAGATSTVGELGLGGAAEGAFTSGPITGGTSGGGGGLFNNILSGAAGQLTRNPLGVAAAGAGLAANMFGGNAVDPNRQKLQDQANQLGAQGQQLQQYLANGTLPPAMQASLDQATKAAKARIIANHARNGQATDPTQNSALAQELSSVETQAVAAMAEAQIKMMTTGLNATGLSTQLYQMLTQMDRQDNQDLMSSISNFAAALGGGSNVRPPQARRAA